MRGESTLGPSILGDWIGASLTRFLQVTRQADPRELRRQGVGVLAAEIPPARAPQGTRSLGPPGAGGHVSAVRQRPAVTIIKWREYASDGTAQPT